jgi:Protein of unknown function (DUF3179)
MLSSISAGRPVIFFLLLAAYAVLPAMAQLPRGTEGQGWRTDWSRRTVDLREIEVNLMRDQIPAISEPRFVSLSEAGNWVGEREPVISIVLGNEARAYPLQILTQHEIVNDRFNSIPVLVTFCPLCYSALAFDRRINGDEYHFGVSGMLRHSDLVMFDRETHSLWQQLSGEGIVGKFSGAQLTPIPAQIISFGQFRDAYPFGVVLSRETGFNRQYGRNPYPGYDDIDDKPWLFRGPIDGRLPPMEKVVAVTIGSTDKAYPHSITRKEHVIEDEIEGIKLVVFHTKKGATSALDKSSISGSRVIGSTGVFSPVLDDGTLLHFSFSNDRFIDAETGSTWDITGRAVDGDLDGRQLRPITHGDVFSFAWFVVKPDTKLYR